jgi:hypothetical protein
MQGKMLRHVLDKMMKHGTAQNARVQVCLPDGKFYDISSLRLMENKIIGHRESHRLVFTVQAETWNMGKILKKLMMPEARRQNFMKVPGSGSLTLVA